MNSFLGYNKRRSPPSDTKNELTEVRYGTQNVLDTELQFFSKSNERIDTCMNYTRLQLAIEIEQIKKAFIDAKNLTEITKENIGRFTSKADR